MSNISKRNDIKKIMIIGAGAVNVGNSGELDSFALHACMTLRELGYKCITVNPNPSAVSNDMGIADKAYTVPLNTEAVTELIKKERPDAILPFFGGKSAIILCRRLINSGVLDEYGVKLLGTSDYGMDCCESMIKFRNAAETLGISTPKGRHIHTMEEAVRSAEILEYPIIVHPENSFTGNEDSLVYNVEELRDAVSEAFAAEPSRDILLSKAMTDCDSLEIEILRDCSNNMIAASAIENVNSCGIHSGDSISVAPMLTVPTSVCDTLRKYAFKIAEAMQLVGFADFKFARDGEKIYILDVNLSVSSTTAISALVSGIPTASAAARLMAGISLKEIMFEGKPLSEYRFDYDEVFVKLPRLPFDVFRDANDVLNAKMHAVGYVAGVGRNFKEALQKAVRSLQNGRYGLGLVKEFAGKSEDELLSLLVNPSSETLFIIYEALKRGTDTEKISAVTGIKPYFIEQLREIAEAESRLLRYRGKIPTEPVLMRAKRMGFSDKYISCLLGTDEKTIRETRREITEPGFEAIGANQRFSTYAHSEKRPVSDKRKLIILGSGANKIGQGMEFDYTVVRAALELKRIGYEVIAINCNPTASSVSQGIFDKVYFEPLTAEDILAVCREEMPDGIITQLGGETAAELSAELADEGFNILGINSELTHLLCTENGLHERLSGLDIPMPHRRRASDLEEALAIAAQIGYPVRVHMSAQDTAVTDIMHDEGTFLEYLDKSGISESNPMLISRFLNHATECEADIIFDGEEIFIPGIMEHIESAGISSGDSACVLPAQNISAENAEAIYAYAKKIALCIGSIGFMNMKFAIDKSRVYVLEVNIGASRTIPLVSKVYKLDMPALAVRVLLGLLKCGEISVKKPTLCAIKEVVFPWEVFSECDPVLGSEMHSTGEVIALDKSFGRAFARAQEATGTPLPTGGTVFISVNDADKKLLKPIVKDFSDSGFEIAATGGTCDLIERLGFKARRVKKIYEGRPNVLDMIINSKIQLIVNTPTDKLAVDDDSYIRKAAVKNSIAYMTTMAAAKAAASGIKEELKKPRRRDK